VLASAVVGVVIAASENKKNRTVSASASPEIGDSRLFVYLRGISWNCVSARLADFLCSIRKGSGRS